jgi:hypothetical protein
MSYNGSGTFNINTTGQPVVAGTVITATAFNLLTADLATGLTTAMTKDGQTTTTARIPFAQGISSTLVTDATNTTSGSIITAGGVGIAKALYVGTNANVAGTLDVTGTTTLTNPVINNIKMGYTTTATAAGTTTLTVASNYRQFFTGSTTQTIVLPVTSTLVTGMAYEIENNSTGLLTVNSSGGNLVGTIPAGVCAHAVCIGTTLTTAADWDWDYISTTTITGTGANVLGTAPTIASLNLTTALTLTGASGTNGQVLTSGGSSVAPTWTTISSSPTAITNGTSNVTVNSSGGSITATTAGTAAVTIDTSQRVGIGTTTTSNATLTVTNANLTSPLYIGSQSDSSSWGGFFVNGATSSTAGNGIYGKSGASFYYNVASGLNHIWTTNGAEKMRIDSGGTLLVGTTSSSVSTTPGVVIVGSSGAQSYLLNCGTTGAGTSMALFYSSYSVANETKFEVDAAGNVKSRTNSYGGFSDERLKQNITPASSQWNDIKSYDVVKFQMKSEQFSDEENPWMLGVVAQQVEKISPGLVDEDIKDGMKTVKYSILYMKAVKALQEAMTRIEALEAKSDTQAETINALTARITALENA